MQGWLQCYNADPIERCRDTYGKRGVVMVTCKTIRLEKDCRGSEPREEVNGKWGVRQACRGEPMRPQPSQTTCLRHHHCSPLRSSSSCS